MLAYPAPLFALPLQNPIPPALATEQPPKKQEQQRNRPSSLPRYVLVCVLVVPSQTCSNRKTKNPVRSNFPFLPFLSPSCLPHISHISKLRSIYRHRAVISLLSPFCDHNYDHTYGPGSHPSSPHPNYSPRAALQAQQPFPFVFPPRLRISGNSRLALF